jgi:hypothetical protein
MWPAAERLETGLDVEISSDKCEEEVLYISARKKWLERWDDNIKLGVEGVVEGFGLRLFGLD